jgi:hypothetical protein
VRPAAGYYTLPQMIGPSTPAPGPADEARRRELLTRFGLISEADYALMLGVAAVGGA